MQSIALWASLILALVFVAAGLIDNREAFVPEVLGGLVGFFVGVPFAVWLLGLQHSQAASAARGERNAELAALKKAGMAEAQRVLGMAKDAEQAAGGEYPVGPVDQIVGYWSEMLGHRFYTLTADDDPLHYLRQAHNRLGDAVRLLKSAESPSPPYDPQRLRGEASMASRAAQRWCEQAIQSLEESSLLEERKAM